MPVENVTFISDLVATNPIGATDPKSQGDDHLRNLKLGLLNTFPNVNGAVTSDQAELNLMDGATGVTGTGSTVRHTSPTFTGTVTNAGSGGVVSSNVLPQFRLVETDSAANNMMWRLSANAEQLQLAAMNDALSIRADIMLVERNGLCIDSISFLTGGDIAGTPSLPAELLRIDYNAGAETVAVRRGKSLRLYDDTNTDYLSLATGTASNAFIAGGGAISNLLSTLNLLLEGKNLDFRDATLADTARFRHDGTDLVLENISGTSRLRSTLPATINAAGAALVLKGTGAGNANVVYLDFQDTNGVSKGYVGDDAGADANVSLVSRAGSVQIWSNDTIRITYNTDGTITTPNANAAEVGFKGVPSAEVNSYTLVLADAGTSKLALAGSPTITIPANASVAFPRGTVVTFVGYGGPCSIAITTDTLYLAGTGFATTGTRTLASGGMASALKISATEWLISGPGLS